MKQTQSKPYLIGLSGGIASGKSSCVSFLQAKGLHCIKLDDFVKDVVYADPKIKKELKLLFGEDLYSPEGQLSYARLAQRAFKDRASQKKLQALVYPCLLEKLKDLLAEYESLAHEQPQDAQDSRDYLLIEAALLDEIPELMDLCDEIVVISCPRKLRRERALKRGMSAEDFDQREALQISDHERSLLADTLIDNSLGEDELKEALEQWWSKHV